MASAASPRAARHPIHSPPHGARDAAAAAGAAAAAAQFHLPLVVDELDVDPSRRPRSPTFDPAHIKGADRIKKTTGGGGVGGGVGGGGVIGPLNLGDNAGSIHACPCCRRYVPGSGGRTAAAPSSGHKEGRNSPESAAQDEEDSRLLGSLIKHSSGEGGGDGPASYEIRETISRGWVHKKGTGKDWLGSRSWKPRWAVLATAAVPGYEVDVPLLLVYWYSSSKEPSNVIVLDDTVVMPVDRYKTEKKVVEWNTFTFEVVRAREDGGDKVTRTFSVPEMERNEWVFAINRAILEYERRLRDARSDRAAREAVAMARRRSVSPPPPPAVPTDCSSWDADDPGARAVSPVRAWSPVRARSPPPTVASSKPPLSPRSPRSPRHLSDVKPPLSPRGSPPPGSRRRVILSPRTKKAALMGGGGSSKSSLTYSTKSVLSSTTSSPGRTMLEDSLAGLNISMPSVIDDDDGEDENRDENVQ